MHGKKNVAESVGVAFDGCLSSSVRQTSGRIGGVFSLAQAFYAWGISEVK